MPEEFKIEASENNAASNQSMEANDAPVSIFDQPFEIQEEGDDLIPVNHYKNNDTEENNNQLPPIPSIENTEENTLDFNKKPEVAEGQKTEEQLIKELQEKGYDIKSPGASENIDTRSDEIKQLQFHISQGETLISQNDDSLIKEKFTDDLKRKYTTNKMEHLIGTEEFNLELEADIEELNENRFNKKIVADNIRRDVSSYMNERKQKLENITGSIKAENQASANANREKLQSQFTNYHKEGFMGIDIPAHIAEETYRDVVSGEFNKKIKNDHDLVAQFALFTKLQETFAEKLGQPTYGEGVKAAFDQINKSGNNGVRNPLAAMSSNNGGSGAQGLGGTDGRF